MKKWEYAREYTSNLDEGKAGWGAEQGWKDMGLEGWELVTIYEPDIRKNAPGQTVAIFKRLKTMKERAGA